MGCLCQWLRLNKTVVISHGAQDLKEIIVHEVYMKFGLVIYIYNPKGTHHLFSILWCADFLSRTSPSPGFFCWNWLNFFHLVGFFPGHFRQQKPRGVHVGGSKREEDITGSSGLQMGVSENRWFSPQIIHFSRVFHYFHHPFWSTTIFGNTQMMGLTV